MRRTHALVIGLAAGGLLAVSAVRHARSGDDDMTATAPVSSDRPALDRDLPAKFETATFALG